MRGAFHSGFLARCKESGLMFDKYIGSSSGFYACLASLAELDYKGFWSDPSSPLYKKNYRRDFFHDFVNFHMPKILRETPLEHDEFLSRINKNLYALTNRLTLLGVKKELLFGYEDFEDVNRAQMASGAIPWLLRPFPYVYRGGLRIDGCFWNRKPASFLDTDIKLILEPSIEYAKPHQDSEIYYYRCTYGKRWKTMVSGTPEDYENIWDCGYIEGEKFLEQLKKDNKVK